ncbi:YkoP family protein [Ectobacillus panaciterrae]|uniref:YkoP family protein n=1 Tax=Ectobacillus panaciterrae TaxID=363872 RepID=UPI00041B8423
MKIDWKKQCFLSIWMKWEKLFQTFFHLKPLDEKNHFLYTRVRAYRGKTIQLADGEKIRKGDCIVELHLNNALLFKMRTETRSSVRLAVQMIRATEQSLPKILPFLLTHSSYQNVKGVYGVSLLHRGAEQFGFTVMDLPKGIFSLCTRIYLRTLLLIVHPQGKQRLQFKTHLLTPKIIAISTRELTRRYPIESSLKREKEND